MADDLPPGYTLDAPAAAPATAGGGGLPAGYKLDEPGGASSREKELRAQYLKDLIAPSEHLKAQETPGTLSSYLHNFTDYSQRLKDSATRGLMRPLGGLMHGVSGVLDPTSTFGERYRAGVGAEEDFANRAVENTPGALGVATDVVGGLGSTGAGTAAVSGGREALGKIMAQGATEGAVEGAARNAKDAESAVKSGLVGAGVGAGASAAVGGATKLIPGVAGKVSSAKDAVRTAARGETPDEIKDVAKSIYKQIDNAGIAYGQPQTAKLKAGLDDLVTTNQYNPIAHQKISGYVDQLDKLAQSPAGAKFSELHNLRSALAKEARGPDASTREAAGKVIGKIDELVHNNQPAINPNNVDIKDAYPRASKLWKAASVADDVGYLAGKAERKVASKAGVNPDEANRGAFRPLLEKTEKPGAYSPIQTKEQKDLLAKIVAGDKGQNMLRGAGAVAGSPTTRLLAGAGAGALGLTGGLGPLASGLGVGGAAIGGLAQKGLNRLAANRGAENIDKLIRNITTGSSAPSTRAPSREALAVLLAKQAAQRGGAAYASSKTGEK